MSQTLYDATLSLARNITPVRENIFAGYEQTIVLIGDSITALNGGGPAQLDDILTYHQSARGFWTWANYYLGQRFWMIANKGVGGEDSSDILARFASDALGYPAGWIGINAGANDIPYNVPAATIIANLSAMVTKALGDKRKVLLMTLPPSIYYSTVAQRKVLEEVNTWILAQASAQVVVADTWAAVQDSTNNGWPIAGFTVDDIHPSDHGAEAMGRTIADALRPVTQARELGDVLGRASFPTVITHDDFAAITGWTGYNGLAISVSNNKLYGMLSGYVASETSASKVTNISTGLFAEGDVIQGSVYCKWRNVTAHTAATMKSFPLFRVELKNADNSIYTYARSMGQASTYDTAVDPALLPTSGEGLLLTPRVTIPSTVDRLYPTLGWHGAESGTFEFSNLKVWKE